MEKTAMQLVVELREKYSMNTPFDNAFLEHMDELLATEKRQIVEAWNRGDENPGGTGSVWDGEQYYTQTFEQNS